MMKNFKKIVALLLCIVMAASVAACGGNSGSGGNAGGNAGGNSVDGSPVSKFEAVEVSAPVTVEFWHTSGGDLGTELEAQIKEFNETNGKGITVKGTYMGGYYDLLTKVKASYGSSAMPDMIVAGAGGIEELAEGGALADLAAYVARDNFDMENIPKSLRYYTEYYEGQIIEFPYLVSTAIVFYNKAYFPDGFPTTLEDWAKQAEQITAANPDVYGMSIPLDIGYIQRPILKSLGAPGLTTDNGNAPATLDDGTMEKFLTDWGTWIDGGYCAPLSVTDSTTKMGNDFLMGKTAAIVNSCAIMASYTESAKEANIDIGYAPSVAYGGGAGAIGGGGLCVMSQSTDQEIAASWEFIKFLYEDDNVIANHKASGYLPITYSAAESDEIKTFWEENPGNKVAFEQLDSATFNEWSKYLQKWRDYITTVITDVLVSKSLNPAEGVAQLKRNASTTFR